MSTENSSRRQRKKKKKEKMHLYQTEIKLLKAAALWRLGRNGSVFLSLGKLGTDSKRQYSGMGCS